MESTSLTVATSDKPKRRRAPRKKPAAVTAQRKASSKISGLVSILAYQGENEALWPTLASFRWFIRNHRSVLVEKGALLEISGRAFVHVQNFEAVVFAVGRAQAMKSGGEEVAS